MFKRFSKVYIGSLYSPVDLPSKVCRRTKKFKQYFYNLLLFTIIYYNNGPNTAMILCQARKL